MLKSFINRWSFVNSVDLFERFSGAESLIFPFLFVKYINNGTSSNWV
jgi:hypothetical protein